MNSTENETPAIAQPILENKMQVMERVREIAANNEAITRQELESLKSHYYRYKNAEQEKALQDFLDANDGEIERYVPAIDPTEVEFRELMQNIRQRRTQELEESERLKQEGLAKKLEILAAIQNLVALSPEEASQHFNEFKQLRADWLEVKACPMERSTELWKNFQLFTEQFYDLLKMGHELREYDFRKNLEQKTRLCEQAEALAEVKDVVKANNTLQNLHQEWKEIGPVAKEIREELWERFRKASYDVRCRHQAFFTARKEEEAANLAKKTALCEEVEKIDVTQLTTFLQWDTTIKHVIELQASWRTTGYVPSKLQGEIYERFRQACDVIFKAKAEFMTVYKQNVAEVLAKKTALVEQVEALKDSTAWQATAEEIKKLQAQWKEAGALPRKQAEQLYERFRQACDYFFTQKKEAEAGPRAEQKENLEKKRAVLAQLEALKESMHDEEDNEAILAKYKELVAAWKAIGPVPFREMDKLNMRFRSLSHAVHERVGKVRRNKQINEFKKSIDKVEDAPSAKLAERRRSFMGSFDRLTKEIKTIETNISFISSNNKAAASVVEMMKKRMDSLRNEQELLTEKIKAIDIELRNRN